MRRGSWVGRGLGVLLSLVILVALSGRAGAQNALNKSLLVKIDDQVLTVTPAEDRITVTDVQGNAIPDRVVYIKAAFIYVVFRRSLVPQLDLLGRPLSPNPPPVPVAAATAASVADFGAVFFAQPVVLAGYAAPLLAGAPPPPLLMGIPELDQGFFGASAALTANPEEAAKGLANAAEARARKAEARMREIMVQVTQQGQPFSHELAEEFLSETFTLKLADQGLALAKKAGQIKRPAGYQAQVAEQEINNQAVQYLAMNGKTRSGLSTTPATLAAVFAALSDPKTGLAQYPPLADFIAGLNQMAREYYRLRFQLYNDAAALYPGGGKALPAYSVFFIVDNSGSMKGLLAGDARSKLEAAQDIFQQLLAMVIGLEVKIEYSLIVFDGCTPTVEASGNPDGRALIRKVRDMTPKGKTPLANSLNTAYDLIAGSRHDLTYLILLTDGREEGCREQADADTAAARFAAMAVPLFQDLASAPPAGAGKKIIFTTIGFLAPQGDEKLLQNLAAAGGGSYFQANNAPELFEILQYTFFRSVVATIPVGSPPPPPEEDWLSSVGATFFIVLCVSNGLVIAMLVTVIILIRRRQRLRGLAGGKGP